MKATESQILTDEIIDTFFETIQNLQIQINTLNTNSMTQSNNKDKRNENKINEKTQKNEQKINKNEKKPNN